MFSDFDKSAQPKEGRGRMGVSFALAAVIFVAIGAALATAIATARAVVQPDRDLDVEFAALPPPPPEPEIELPPPPPPPRAARPRRPGARRPDLGPPREIPNEQPEESEGDLGDAGDVGPVENGEGDGDGDGGGEAPAPVVPPPPAPPPGPPTPPRPEPEQVRETVPRPRYLSGCPSFPALHSLSTGAATVRIELRWVVSADGTVESASIVEPHPFTAEEVELLLGCIRERRYEPAHLPDGTAVRYPMRLRPAFRPDSL